MNIDAVNFANLLYREATVLSDTMTVTCPCGASATVDKLSDAACCDCYSGDIQGYVKHVQGLVIEQEERRLREARENMGVRKVSYAKKVRGVWR